MREFSQRLCCGCCLALYLQGTKICFDDSVIVESLEAIRPGKRSGGEQLKAKHGSILKWNPFAK
jgi:hypothetical protein